jgi:hypothetical protein
MNTKSAKKLIEAHGLTLLRWNGKFTIATVRTANGETQEIHNDGGREKMLKRLKQFKSSPDSTATSL